MKRGLALAAVCTAMVAMVSVSQAQDKGGMGMPKTETVSGVLVDTRCYGMMPKENAGNDHMVMMGDKMSKVPACAAACANLGIPVALKLANGKTLVLAAPANQLSKHMAEEVKLMGVYSQDKATFIAMRVIPKTGEPYDIKTMM